MGVPVIRGQNNNSGSVSASGSLSVNTPTNVLNDPLILLITGSATSPTLPSPPSGWSTVSGSSATNAIGLCIAFQKQSGGSEPASVSVTFPTAGTYQITFIALNAGASPPSTANAGSEKLSLTGTTLNFNVTTTASNCIIVTQFFFNSNGTITLTSPNTAAGSSFGTTAQCGQQGQSSSGTFATGASTSGGSGLCAGTAVAWAGGTTSSQLSPPVLVESCPNDYQVVLENVLNLFRLVGPIFGGIPSAPGTPPTLRLVLIGGTEDTLTNQVPATSALLLGGRPNASVTPPTLRSVLLAPAEDLYSNKELPPAYAALYGGKPNAPVTPPSLRPVIADQTPYGSYPHAEDTISNQVPPYGEVLGGTPHIDAQPIVLRQVLQSQTEDVLSSQIPAKGDVKGGPTKTAAVESTPIIYASTEDNLSYQIPPARFINLALNPGIGLPKTGPRIITVGTSEDNLSYQTPPAKGNIIGGTPNAPVTGPTLRPVNTILAEDTISSQIPPSVSIGGRANKPATPPTLRPLYGTYYEKIVGEQFIIEGNPNTNRVQLGGQSNKPTTPPSQRPALVVLSEDNLSQQRSPEAYQYGGKPFAKVQTTVLRPPLITLAEDNLSYQRPAEGKVIIPALIGKLGIIRTKMIGIGPDDAILFLTLTGELELLSDKQVFQPHGGKPNNSVTPPSLRSPIVVLTEDSISYQRNPEYVKLGVINTTPATPPTLRHPLIIPVNVLSEDSQAVQRQAEGKIIGAIPLPPVRGNVLPLIIKVDETVLLDPAPSAYIISKRDPKAVTPVSPNFRLSIGRPEDIISYQEPQARAVLLGGKPSKAVTPPGGPRLIIFGNTEDGISREPIRITVIQGATFTKIGAPPFTPISDIYAPTVTNIKGSG